MSNADGDVIPIVEDDKTGETYQDLVENFNQPMTTAESRADKNRYEYKPSNSEIMVYMRTLESKLNRIMVHLGCDDKRDESDVTPKYLQR